MMFSLPGRKPQEHKVRRLGALLGLMVGLLLLTACNSGGQSASAVAQLPEPTSSAAQPTDTPTPAPTATPTAIPTATPTPLPTDTPTPAPTDTPTPTPTPEPAAGRPPASPDIVYVGTPTAPDGRPQVNLSFDVEGNPELLYQILDILDQFNYRTTFFMQGEWVQQNPEAVQRIAERGHELGNHSWTHGDFKPMSAEQVTKELMDTETLVQELTGQTTKPYFRPPFGSRSKISVPTAYELGWTTIIWTYGSEDWRDGATAQTIYDNVFGNAAPGALYYMHTSRQIDVEALPRLLQAFQDAGYALVSVGEILGGPTSGQ